MTHEQKIKALIEAGEKATAGHCCPEWMATAIRHVVRNCDEQAIQALDFFCHAVAAREYTKLPRSQWAALVSIDKHAKKLGVPYELSPGSKNGVPAARIEMTEMVPALPVPPVIKGETSVYGTCYWAGGKDHPIIWLQLDDGKELRVVAPKLVAQEAAKRLYEVIGLDGEATWDPDTYDMLTFRAHRMNSFKASSPAEGFKKLAEAAGDALDGVGPSEFMANVRGNEDGDAE